MNTILCDSDYDQDVIIEDDAGAVQDITEWTFEFLCIPDGGPVNGSRRIFLQMDSGLTLQDPTNGVLRISMTADQTKNFGKGSARVLLWRTDSGMRKIIGEGSTTFEGKTFDA